jgi:site-specific DNA-methyltransferase (adenine-specific)
MEAAGSVSTTIHEQRNLYALLVVSLKNIGVIVVDNNEQSEQPSPYFSDGSCVIYNGDCADVLLSIPDNSIDAVVTDPPYGLSFMGKRWDYDVPSVDVWVQCLRVLKPGGHLLAFAGTRTQHRMAVRIEDAGFEIRDMIAWVYGSGFPKSMDVSKAIDKAAGAERDVVGEKYSGIARVCRSGLQIVGGVSNEDAKYIPVTAPSTESAKQWEGWGTALKPALEPITMARKPIPGTVADNVQKHGTGALNINGARIDLGGDYKCKPNGRPSQTGLGDNYDPSKANQADTVGRWPANLIHDGSEEVVRQFPETTSGANPTRRSSAKFKNAYSEFAGQESCEQHRGADSGNASRFFYTAKADSSERRGSKHPTVKPLDLMRYLVRLVCPIGSTVLDPFMGSGTTIEAARLENCKSIGIERETQYCSDAIKRIRQQVMFVG